jgi:hypothetical protein
MENIITFNTDCLGNDGLCIIDDKSIDMILCDPPFGITANPWDTVLDLNKLFGEYDRIIKDNGAVLLFGNQPFTTDLINAYRKRFKYSLVLEKGQGTDFMKCKVKPLKAHEDIMTRSAGVGLWTKTSFLSGGLSPPPSAVCIALRLPKVHVLLNQ